MKKKTSTLYLHGRAPGKTGQAKRTYDRNFKASPAYRASLPDLMEAEDVIEGARTRLHQVGVSGFRLPLQYKTKSGKRRELETRVTGTVSAEADEKGINMSRILRSFYEHRQEAVSPASLKRVLEGFRKRLGSLEARVRLNFSYPMLQKALRSGLEGIQYYRCAYEAAISPSGKSRTFIEFDFVYSSACPCSAELAEHARHERGVYAVPHTQRSKARLRLELRPGARVTLEDIQALCLSALSTETQVMVKREDEQAFAELNGASLKFVEDAVRLLFARLEADKRFIDFRILCSHLESLHSHDAVSVAVKGVRDGMKPDFMDFESLLC